MEEQELVGSLSAITGLDAETAQTYLEAYGR